MGNCNVTRELLMGSVLLVVSFPLGTATAAQDGEERDASRRGRIEGNVVSDVTGKPVAGAYVGVGDFGDSGGSNYARHRAQGLHAASRTDENGRFVLTGLVPTDKHAGLDYHPLVITHNGFVPHHQNLALPTGTEVAVKVRLRAAASFQVRVVDADGRPLHGHLLVRIEALDGHRFIPPGKDRHLSAFRSSAWTQHIQQGEFTFTELEQGLYSADAIRFDPPTKGHGGAGGYGYGYKYPPAKSAGTRYHAGVASVALKAGETTRLELKPQSHGTRLTIQLPEVPEKVKAKLPSVVVVSRNVGLLLWNDGRIHHPEDPRLGRITEQLLFAWVIPAGRDFVVENLPTGAYSVFAGPPVLMTGTRVTLTSGREDAITLPWVEPQGTARVRVDGLDRSVRFDAQEYSVDRLCELLTGATGARPTFRANPSIREEHVRVETRVRRVWDVLESLYLHKGWVLAEEGRERLILKPGNN